MNLLFARLAVGLFVGGEKMKAERGTGTLETRRHRLDFISSHFLANRNDSPWLLGFPGGGKQTNKQTENLVSSISILWCMSVCMCVYVLGECTAECPGCLDIPQSCCRLHRGV